MEQLSDHDWQEYLALQKRLVISGGPNESDLWFYSLKKSTELVKAASRLLVAAGADPTVPISDLNLTPYSLTPFEYAVRSHRKDVVRFYVEEGYQDIDSSNRKTFFELAASIEEWFAWMGASADRIEEAHKKTIEMRSLLTELEVAAAVSVGGRSDAVQNKVVRRKSDLCL